MPSARTISGLLAFLLIGCSGGGQSGYDYGKIRKMADASLDSQAPLIGYEQLVLLPKEQTGETHRLIVYPEGVSSYKTAIFQLSPTDIIGIEEGFSAFRHGAGNYLGEKFVGVWNENRLERILPVISETVLPISRPEIPRDRVPELALMALTKDKPFEGLIYSDPAKEIYERLSVLSKADANDPVSQELADLEAIFETTPLVQNHERRTDLGLGEELLLMVWDDGFSDPAVTNIDPQFSQILMATNFADTPQLVPLPETHQLRLHPGQTLGADGQVRKTQIVLDGVIIPANTSAVLVRRE